MDWILFNKDTIENEFLIEHDDFYGDRYSEPVIIGNINTGQKWGQMVRWDFEMKGWVDECLSNGPHPADYEFCYVSHYSFLPKWKVEE